MSTIRILGLGIFAATILAPIAAHANAASACPTTTISSTFHGRSTAACACDKEFAARQPVGSKIYYETQYVVVDGHRMVHFSLRSKLWCAGDALHVTDPLTGRAGVFSTRASIILWKHAREFAVRPGQPMQPALRRLIQLKLASLYKTVAPSSSQATKARRG